ncbi:MAG: hypothetical protein BAJALOKI3v1_580019 [Promethearchaeota archaeon]|nr:MAG: hypothetical protein BAJALOKI3v1_580019 [Candidatus Lokiarchaeota archaeon]
MIDWPPSRCEFPDNFIERMIAFDKCECELTCELLGRSSYHEYTDATVWDEGLLEDIHAAGEGILNFIACCSELNEKSYFGKRIVSLDIETTTWFPKAYEGFVNILGMSVLDLREGPIENSRLLIHQTFNMLRKKEKACHLLHLALDILNDADIVLVFNKGFDIKILNTIIENFCIEYEFPETIVDLKDSYRSLAHLEQFLKKKVKFRRLNSEKGKYPDYYKLFKGKGSKGVGKQIEPIGIYNIMDTLTPLYAFLLLE